MAKIIRRVWYARGPLGRRVKLVAYGYTRMVHGQQDRIVRARFLAAFVAGLLVRRLTAAAIDVRTSTGQGRS